MLGEQEFAEWIANWTKRLLDPYLALLDPPARPPHEKEINDPVCHTILLYPAELVLLDSPLLQRLRRIRQLGVAHLVYPSAGHTRFEHTLGVVHFVQQLISSVNLHATKDLIDATQQKILRIGALSHDIGHGALSHVSENALANFREVGDLILSFQEKHELAATPKISEIGAYLMVKSDAYRQLLRKTAQFTEAYELGEPEVPEMIGKMILGDVIVDNSPLLQELLSGPFDADKLDYLSRDALMCGVPAIVDVPRLIQKIRAVNVAQNDLPLDFASRVHSGHSSYTMIGVARSGARALDELAVGRSLMADKVYRHQKVRAAEAMVAAVFDQIAADLATSPVLFPYLVTDDQFFDLNEDTLKRLDQKQSLDKVKTAVALDLLSRIKARRLFVRAFAYAQSMPLDPYAKDADQRVGIEELMSDASSASTRKTLISEIASQLRDVLAALHEDKLLGGLADLTAYIAIDPAAPSRDTYPDAARAFLLNEDGTLMRFWDDYGETQGWADAYLSTRDLGYIFTTAELSPYLYLVAEALFREKYGIRMPTSMIAYSNQSPDLIDTVRRRLAQVGYYASKSRDLHPTPERLTRADIPKRVERVMEALRGYVSPLTDDPERAAPGINSSRVLDWVRQFDDDDVDSALRVLEQVRLIGRHETVDAVRSFLSKHEKFAHASLCILGGPQDSSAVNSYWAMDLAGQYDLNGRSLYEAVGRDAPILFVDDFVGTGSQAKTIVGTWFGEEIEKDLHEYRGQPLDAALRELLRAKEVAFVFAAGKHDGKKAFEEYVKRLIPNSTTYVHISAESLPVAFGRHIFHDEATESRFKARSEAIGIELLRDDSVGHDEAWARQRSLGYGNDAFLIVFPNNTPTATVTSLWASGKVKGLPWTPLLPRRPKT